MARSPRRLERTLFVVKRDKNGIHPPKPVRKNITMGAAIDYALKKGDDGLDSMYLMLHNGELYTLCSPAPDGYMWEPCNQ